MFSAEVSENFRVGEVSLGKLAAPSPMELLIVKMSILIASDFLAPACITIRMIPAQKIVLSGVNYWKCSQGTTRQTQRAKQSYAYSNNFEVQT